MTGDEKQHQLRLGFLTAAKVPDRGYVGGLLITNHYGRPLEFQCTSPVRPNRAQEILYGPTLRPFLLGELIGGTLIEKASIKPDLVLTENNDLLELRNHVTIPVVCITGNVADGMSARLPDASTADVEPLPRVVTIGRQKIRFHSAHLSDCRLVEQTSHLVPQDADLLEPFGRVREALQETMNTGTIR